MFLQTNRRELLKTLGMGAAAIFLPGLGLRTVPAAEDVPVIETGRYYPKGQYFFEPAGLHIQKGQTVRWAMTDSAMAITITAFHPSNQNHELRIPEGAKPFDSGIILKTGARGAFEWKFDVEGTYDYFSLTFEPVGMVGRIVVGKPGGPAEKFPPGYGGRDGRAVVYPAQSAILNALPSSEIIAKKSIPYPRDLVVRTFPYSDLNR